MAPKPPKQSASRGKAEETKEDPLQAVLLADTFEKKFTPFTLERPRCLLPLLNTPLIEYTLDYLASAGVQDVYIYAGAHVDQVETYVNASRWKHSTSPFRNLTFLRCVATSVGDVMRDLDQKHLIAGDFIAVSGDVICNVPIDGALKTHKARREKDKNAIMTMLLRQTEPGFNIGSNSITPLFVIDPTKDRCLHYEEGVADTMSNAHVDPEILKCPEIDVRQDLVDCRIDICTPDVLSLWSDNFDNQTPRRDFLFGVLKDYELNGKTIHTYIVDDRYAARAGDLLAYNTISYDLSTKIFPSLTAENNLYSNTRYNRPRKGPSCDKGVIMARPRRIDSKTILGADTSIGANTSIKQSTIGARCLVGKSTHIEESYIWDDATIGSNVQILRAIIGSESFVGDNCVIGEGALISFGVKIAPGTNVPAGAQITKAQQERDQRKSGLNGGHRGERLDYFDEDLDHEVGYHGTPGLVYQQPDFQISTSTLDSEVSEPPSNVGGSRSQSFATSMSDEDHTDRFQHETVTILTQRMEEGQKADDMLSELMGLRFGGGADETQVRKAVALALVKHIQSDVDGGRAAADVSRKVLSNYRTLIRREQAEQTTEEQVLFLLDVQRDLSHRNEGAKILLFMTKDLYDLEVFTEESFLAWWSDARSYTDSDMAEVRKQTAQFIQWLEDAESEDDSEEDDGDEDEEDD